jgi:uncharacterized protein
MIELLEKHRSQLIELCVQHRVKSLELFGSAATEAGFQQGNSDIDFLVEFQELPAGTSADTYFSLLEKLEHLLQHRVDLVMVRAINNTYFLQRINQTRELLYAA